MSYADLLDKANTLLFALVIPMPRLLAAFSVVPLLASQAIPVTVRVALALSFSLFLFPMNEDAARLVALSPILWIAILVKEVFIGFCLGFVCSIFIWVVEGIGALLDTVVGNNNLFIFNPVISQESGPFSILLGQVGSMLFLAFGGFLVLLKALFASFLTWPVLSFFPELTAAGSARFISWGGDIIFTSMRLAMPILTMLVLVDFGLGLVNRSVSQLNAYSLSMPIKALVATLFMALTLVFIGDPPGPLFTVLYCGLAFLRITLC